MKIALETNGKSMTLRHVILELGFLNSLTASRRLLSQHGYLNTHSISSLYKAFPPEEARRIARKLEVHYTPKHGSWLDIAEIGISIMTRECLDRRIPDIQTLRNELKEWNDAYNQNPSPVNWQFQTSDSRKNLRDCIPM